MAISKNLEFNMPWLFDIFFYVDRSVAKSLLCFVAGNMKFLRKRDVIMRNAHSSATTTSHCFNNDGIADFAGRFDRFCFAIDGTV